MPFCIVHPGLQLTCFSVHLSDGRRRHHRRHRLRRRGSLRRHRQRSHLHRRNVRRHHRSSHLRRWHVRRRRIHYYCWNATHWRCLHPKDGQPGCRQSCCLNFHARTSFQIPSCGCWRYFAAQRPQDGCNRGALRVLERSPAAPSSPYGRSRRSWSAGGRIRGGSATGAWPAHFSLQSQPGDLHCAQERPP